MFELQQLRWHLSGESPGPFARQEGPHIGDACGCYLKLESPLAAFLPQLQGKTVSCWQTLVPLSPGPADGGRAF